MKNKINLIFFTLFFLKNDLKSSNNNNGIRKSSSLGSLNGRCNISIEQIQPKNPFNNQLSQESNYNNSNDIMNIINGTGSSENYNGQNSQDSQEIGNSNLSNMQQSNLSNQSNQSRIYEKIYFNKLIERKNAKIEKLEKELQKREENFEYLLYIMGKYSKYIQCMDERDNDFLQRIFNESGFEYNNQKRQIIGESKLPGSSEEENEDLFNNQQNQVNKENRDLFNNQISFTIKNCSFPSKESLENMQNKPDENGLLGINSITNNNNNAIENNNNVSFITKIIRYLNI